MAKQSNPIHLIQIRSGHACCAVCNLYIKTEPIEATIKSRPSMYYTPKGTFDPNKVTCKRCLKSGDYKIAMDRLKFPLFFLKEGIV